MRRIKIISNAHSEKLREEFKMADVTAFIQGRYVIEALLCTVGNMMPGNSKKFTYPERAYSMADEEERLTEDEKELQRQQFIASLQVMQQNFNISKEEQKRKQKTEDPDNA